MMKVFLVDDEFYFRQYLKACIDWGALDCEIAGEASDGEEALEAVRKIRPDIILLDINMPCMDGLEFSRILSGEHPESRIIILSGHSEFQYAQRAIKYGVKSYLLKPLNEEELIQTIREMRKELEEQRSYQRRLELLEKRQRPLLEEKWLSAVLEGEFPSGTEQAPLKENHFFQVLALEIDGKSQRSWDSEERELWYYAAKNVTRELLPGSLNVYFGKDGYGRILCLLESEESVEKLREHLKICADRITTFASRHFPFSLTAGLGSGGKGISNIARSCRQAVFSLENSYVQEGKYVMDYEETKSSVSRNTFLNSDRRSRILICLRQGDQQSLEKLLLDVFRDARLYKISYDMLQCHCTEFIFLCLEYMEETDIPLEEIFMQIDSPLDMLEGIRNIDEAEQEILGLYRRIFQYIHTHRNTRASRQITEIKEYIGAHFGEQDFKISDIAEAFALNYHYLCHSFKQQTGVTLNQYITSVRIAAAKRLLEQGYCNLTYVAEKAGYGDLGYFGKCFRKQTGISPSQYLEQCKKKDQ